MARRLVVVAVLAVIVLNGTTAGAQTTEGAREPAERSWFSRLFENVTGFLREILRTRDALLSA